MEKIILKVTEKDRMRLRELAKQQYEDVYKRQMELCFVI